MAPKPPIEDETEEFKKQFAILSSSVISLTNEYIKKGLEPLKSFKRAFDELEFKKKLGEMLSKSIIKSIEIGLSSKLSNPELFIKEYLNTTWVDDGFTLAESIAEAKYRQVAIDTIKHEFRTQTNFRKLAQSLTDNQIVKGELPEHLKKLIKIYNIGNYTTKELKRELFISKRQIERLQQNGAPTKNLKTAYSQIIAKIEKGNKNQINRAIRSAIRDKARYNAERIARTEMARAYGLGFDIRAKDTSDVAGIKYSLSSRHPEYDICDFHTKANLYNLGKGVYPIRKQPPYPFHPHCLCVKSLIFNFQVEKEKPFSSKNAEKFLNNTSKQERNLLFGIEKGKDFEKNPKSWRNFLRNWNGHEKPQFDKIKGV